ncbi:cysteine desulfurase family protein [Fusibacter sp. JL298sf-3]
MEIYLDHASTTPVAESVHQFVASNLEDLYGNPSSLHRKGVAVEREVQKVRKFIARQLNCKEKQLIFTSGGTEANNLAIKGTIGSRKGRIIVSAVEHPSVRSTIDSYAANGYDTVVLPVDENGVVEVASVLEALTPETLLISVMHVNNEVGAIQPIGEIGAAVAAYNAAHGTSIRFHVDAVQSFGKMPIDVVNLQVDLMTFSAHKLNSFKGTGLLYVKEPAQLKPLFTGGQQEGGLRPGTENTLGILAFGKALGEKMPRMVEDAQHVAQLKQAMLDVFKAHAFITVNGSDGSPYILNVSILGAKGEVMLHSLEMAGIYVSTGSACSSKKRHYSHVLEAMGLDDAALDSAIRISFGRALTEAAVVEAAHTIVRTGEDLRKIMMKKGR